MFARNRARSSGSLAMSYRNETVHTPHNLLDHVPPYVPDNGPNSGLPSGPIQDPSEGPVEGPVEGPTNGLPIGSPGGPINGPVQDPIQGPIQDPISGTPSSPTNGLGPGVSIDDQLQDVPNGIYVPNDPGNCPPGAPCPHFPTDPAHSAEVTGKPVFHDNHGLWYPQPSQTVQPYQPVQPVILLPDQPGSPYVPVPEHHHNAPTPTLETAPVYAPPGVNENFNQVLSTISTSSAGPSPTQPARPSVLFFSGRPVPPSGIRGWFPNGPTPNAKGRYPLPGSIEWRRQEARYYKYILSQEWEQRAQICIFLIIFLSVAVAWLVRQKKKILRRERLERIQGPRPKPKKNKKTRDSGSRSTKSKDRLLGRKSKGTQDGDMPGVILCEV